MLRKTVSALAIAALFAGLGASAAYAKHKHKHHMHKPAMTAASCTASPLMRDESRFWACFPQKR